MRGDKVPKSDTLFVSVISPASAAKSNTSIIVMITKKLEKCTTANIVMT